MKDLSILIMVSVLFCGCLTNYPSVSHEERLSYVPVEPGNAEIEFYFPTDSLPKDEFFYILDLKVFGDPNIGRDSIISKLKAKGRSVGVDAIIISDKSFKPWLDTTIDVLEDNIYKVTLDFNGDMESEPIYVEKWAMPLMGTGVKYLKNMEYIQFYNKSETVEGRSVFTGNFWEAAKINYNIEGMIIDLKDTMGYLYYFDRYSMSHLIHEENDQWSMRVTDDNLLVRKYYAPDKYFLKKCVIEFDEFERPARIDISYRSGRPTETIYCFYDNRNRLIRREMHLNKYGVLIEKRNYDELGRLEYSVYIDEKGKYKFRRTWEYFKIQDLYDFKKSELSLSNKNLN